jgi:hypothetical protein
MALLHPSFVSCVRVQACQNTRRVAVKPRRRWRLPLHPRPLARRSRRVHWLRERSPSTGTALRRGTQMRRPCALWQNHVLLRGDAPVVGGGGTGAQVVDWLFCAFVWLSARVRRRVQTCALPKPMRARNCDIFPFHACDRLLAMSGSRLATLWEQWSSTRWCVDMCLYWRGVWEEATLFGRPYVFLARFTAAGANLCAV